MNPFKSTPATLVGLVAVAIIALALYSMFKGDGPSSAIVKALAEKDMKARFKGCVIKSMIVIQGSEFPCQGHRGKAPYGTPIYPDFVRAVYTVPAANGSGDQTKEYRKTYFMFNDSSHQWVKDTDLN